MHQYLDYLAYNREERDMCAHLFRLLLEDQPRWRPLKDFLEIDFNGHPRIYCEAALVRDAYYERKIRKDKVTGKPESADYLKDLCELIAAQEGVAPDAYTKFSGLEPEELRQPWKTHPKQIAYKLKDAGTLEKPGDIQVYGALQAMFNAKPDLVICVDDTLYIFEAKYTMPFDEKQLERTENIGKVWAELLFADLGFESRPEVVVRKLGLDKKNSQTSGESKYSFMSWVKVYQIANKYWKESDFSMNVFLKRIPH
ncbi:hypothetical protein G9409_02725 [Chlorobium sp. BLA1]|uniref:hypothetical protein n=1 Tax=Candidatus Chlorobium masyuteum TaxID=2716876 RepID=UPI0014201338|nr:hypothetical protein [Candidatus Chlorobium masyuteum]NHQ59515.1 hypothetical protein [Candidatus Chlorobium masyuteum]NTU45187.1 hypothetical protein [Chlorobiaceae bacterium]